MTWDGVNLIAHPGLDNDRTSVTDPRVKDINLGVIHYGVNDSFGALVRYMEGVDKNPDVSASYHGIVGDGHYVELLDPKKYRAWHAGRSSLNIDGRDWTSVNMNSIGICMSNKGFTEQKSEKCTVPAPLPGTGTVVWWEPYSEEDIIQLVYVCNHYEKNVVGKEIPWVGHSTVSPGRKSDPGPMFPWAEFYSMLHLVRGGVMIDRAPELEDTPVATMPQMQAILGDLNTARAQADRLVSRNGRILLGKIEDALAWGVYMETMR